MPYQALIPILRDALKSLRSRAERLESRWHVAEREVTRTQKVVKEVAESREVGTKLDTRRHTTCEAVSSSTSRVAGSLPRSP